VGISLSIVGRPRYDYAELWLDWDTVGAKTMDHLACLTFFNFSDVERLHHTVQRRFSDDCMNRSSVNQSRLYRYFILS
jgi:hypothetical protein